MIKHVKFLLFFCLISIQLCKAMEMPTPPERPYWLDQYEASGPRRAWFTDVDDINQTHAIVNEYYDKVKKYHANLAKWEKERQCLAIAALLHTEVARRNCLMTAIVASLLTSLDQKS